MGAPVAMRFGVSAVWVSGRDSWAERCRRYEAWGFDTLNVGDHVGFLDPFVALAAAAGVTEKVGLVTYTLNVEFWNPLLLARAAATTDVLSDGRLVLGLGAGHAQVEFEQAGLPYPAPGDRVAKLGRVLDVVRRLLDGETVDDEALGLQGAATGIATSQDKVPLLVGGNGARVLDLGARVADRVGLVGFTSGTGQTHSDLSHWTWAGLAERLGRVRAAAGERSVDIEVLVQHVEVTEDRQRAAAKAAERTGTDASVHLDSPFLLFGTEAEITAQLERLAAAGISGVTVFEHSAEALAPVMAAAPS